jgi:tetratricopeptide (TPR) repeat protein
MQAGYSSLQEQAKKLHESCQLEEALPLYHKLYSSAISSNSLTSELLDDYADLCSSLGDLDFSIKLYTQSIQLFPTVNPSKYFSYAQLVCGQESVEMYLKGIAMCGETEKSQIAAAYSALIEIYMTDLW